MKATLDEGCSGSQGGSSASARGDAEKVLRDRVAALEKALDDKEAKAADSEKTLRDRVAALEKEIQDEIKKTFSWKRKAEDAERMAEAEGNKRREVLPPPQSYTLHLHQILQCFSSFFFIVLSLLIHRLPRPNLCLAYSPCSQRPQPPLPLSVNMFCWTATTRLRPSARPKRCP
jgi:hypothetical protein